MKKFALVSTALSNEAQSIRGLLEKLNAQVDDYKAEAKIESKNYDALILALDEKEMGQYQKSILQDFHQDSSPIGAFYHSPLLVAQAIGDYGVALAADTKYSDEIEKLGAEFIDCNVDDFITDRQNKIVSAPPNVNEAGIRKSIAEIFEMS